MKKLFFNKVTLIVLAAVTFFSSCKKDDDDTDPENVNPSIAFVAGTGNTTGDISLAVGEEFTVEVIAKENSTSGKKLTKFNVNRIFGGVNTPVIDSTISADNFSHKMTFKARDVAGVETWKFMITDKDGKMDHKEIKITTEGLPSDIHSYTSILLGADDNTQYGSFLSTSDGAVFKLTPAKENSAKIDLGYYYGATNKATIASPAETGAGTIEEVYPSLKDWGKRNKTMFVDASSVVDGEAFDKIMYDSELQTAGDKVVFAETSVKDLKVGNVLGFKTEAGKVGFIKIVSLQAEKVGSITIAVKVQK